MDIFTKVVERVNNSSESQIQKSIGRKFEVSTSSRCFPQPYLVLTHALMARTMLKSCIRISQLA